MSRTTGAQPNGPGTTDGADAGRPPSRAAGLLLGLGLGGFVDGIVLHQILQWHHMLSHEEPTDTVAGLELNTLADGFFHVATWALVLAGSLAAVAAWRAGRLAPSWGFHLGLVVAGWGVFNVVEGLVNHQLLGVHHVRDDLGAPLAWDLGFLALGVLLVAGGWLWHRHGLRQMRQMRQMHRTRPRA
ncbi:DUF2243 domain-containing protein [Nocardioides sp. SYSU DS0651]|uniref:DUF2243 domain-containing protein n=1 Tax=Nocardioides sp. SYSU DS0651 TaxID=3415955 RepID=UPI003F4B6D40